MSYIRESHNKTVSVRAHAYLLPALPVPFCLVKEPCNVGSVLELILLQGVPSNFINISDDSEIKIYSPNFFLLVKIFKISNLPIYLSALMWNVSEITVRQLPLAQKRYAALFMGHRANVCTPCHACCYLFSSFICLLLNNVICDMIYHAMNTSMFSQLVQNGVD